MPVNIGPKIGIEGEAEFRRQINTINQEYRTMTAEMKKVTAAFGENDNSQEKLVATSKILEKQVENQRKKVELMKQGLEKATEKFGESDARTLKWRQALYEAETKLTGLEKELDAAGDSMDDANQGLKDFTDTAEDAGKATLDLGDIIKGSLVADVIKAGVRELNNIVKDFASGMIESSSNIQAENAQFSQTLGNLETQAKGVLERMSDDVGIAATRMQGSYTKIFAFAKTAGADSQEAMNIAERAMLAAADSAAYYDRSVEDATETLQSFLKGNYANDAALGIAVTETTRNAAANKLYAKSFKELSESQKVDVLLSMVEAGNKASGALGQAARESGEWANVSGELTEEWRQLQGAVGKPFLESLITVVQKLTGKMAELRKNTDWEEFGNTISETLGWIIDNGPATIKTTGAIAAGFAAFKTTQKVMDLGSIVTEFMSLGSAATAAGTAVTASSTAMAASPWGLAALAIGGVVTALTGLALNAETSAERVVELTKAADELTEVAQTSGADYEKTEASILGAATAAENYADRLRELESQGLNTAAAQKEYELTVDAINGIIPDLNLQINEQTGLLQDGTDALYDQIDGWKDYAIAEAMQNRMKRETQAVADAMVEQATNQAKLNMATQRYDALCEERAAKEARISELNDKIAEAQREQEAAMNRGDSEAYTRWTNQLEGLNGELHELAYTELPNLNDEITASSGEVDDLTAAVEKDQDTINQYEEVLGYTEDAWKDYRDEVEVNTEDVAANMDAMEQAYADMYDACRENLDGQIGMFQKMDDVGKTSIEDLISAFDSQIKFMDDYAKNMEIAMTAGVDKALLEKLSDGSVESAAILAGIAADFEEYGQESVDNLNEKFGEVANSKDTLAKGLAECKTTLEEGLDEIEESSAAAGTAIGAAIAGGAIGEIERQAPIYSATVGKFAGAGQYAFRKMDQINSPSKAYAAFASYDADGAILEFKRREKDMREAVESFAAAGQEGMGDFEYNVKAAAERNYNAVNAAVPYLSGGTTDNRRTMNLGGITLYVNAPNTNDVDQLAEMVSQKIVFEVERREGAFGGK